MKRPEIWLFAFEPAIAIRHASKGRKALGGVLKSYWHVSALFSTKHVNLYIQHCNISKALKLSGDEWQACIFIKKKSDRHAHTIFSNQYHLIRRKELEGDPITFCSSTAYSRAGVFLS